MSAYDELKSNTAKYYGNDKYYKDGAYEFVYLWNKATDQLRSMLRNRIIQCAK